MKKIAIEMSTELRQAFKTACVLNQISMKDALVSEVENILDFDEVCYTTHRPKMGDGMCVLCLNVEEDFLNRVKERKEVHGDKIRDVYITAVINYLLNNESSYDYSQDVDEV